MIHCFLIISFQHAQTENSFIGPHGRGREIGMPDGNITPEARSEQNRGAQTKSDCLFDQLWQEGGGCGALHYHLLVATNIQAG